MVIIVYSTETKDSIAANIGTRDYSYYFVLEKYRRVLEKFAAVIEVRHPAQEVDIIYEKCQARKESCLFLSFAPPFKTEINLKCPTIPVFAWEYTTVPTDAWGDDMRNDWRNVFREHGCAITISSFAVRAVKKAMGEDFPAWSIPAPAPVWDDSTKLYRKEKALVCSEGLQLSFRGAVVDFQGCNTPMSIDRSSVQLIEQKSDATGEDVRIDLQGILYTTVFNPNDGRKNWTDLLRGFIWAFRDIEDVTLVMKLVYHDYEAVRDMVIDEIKKLAPFKCRVVALHGYLDDADYAALIGNSTYIVNTSHGEGQCLPLMEYMSAGKPAIAPAHTAMEDYISDQNAFVVGSSLEWYHWPHDPRAAFRTQRYRINWESLYRAYLESYSVAKDDPDRYARMSQCAVESLEKYCSTAVVEKKLRSVLEERAALQESRMVSTSRRAGRSLLHTLRLVKAKSNITQKETA